MPQRVLEFCERERDWLLDIVEVLVRCESPTTDKAAVDRCGAELSSRLTHMGGRVQRLPRAAAGDHLIVEFGCGAEQVLLLGHVDTVWPLGQLERMPVRREDGRLFGPGVFDMKAGIGLAMLAIRAVQEVPVPCGRRIVMLLTSDEETGSETSRAAIEDEARRSEAVLVLEPALPGGAVKTHRKGCGTFELTVTGVAAHAGVDPAKGASAIHELARQMAAIECLNEPAHGVSVHIGVIEGGTRPNVVAERARAVIDVRVPALSDGMRIEAALRALRPVNPSASLDVRGGFDRPPMERTPSVARLFETAAEVAATLGRTLSEGGTGGGSDGNFTAALGVPTLDGLGAVGDGAHAVHEHVIIADLGWRAALLAGLMGRLGER